MKIDWTQLLTREAREERRNAETIEAQKARARAYLAQTDWYVTRRTETAEKIPQDITDKRTEARKLLG